MNIFIVSLLLLPKIWAISESNATTIHMNQILSVPVNFSIDGVFVNDFSNFAVQARSWDENVVKVNVESFNWMNDLKLVNVTLKITGIFLGTSQISVNLTTNEVNN